jgi:hypothetical protein
VLAIYFSAAEDGHWERFVTFSPSFALSEVNAFSKQNTKLKGVAPMKQTSLLALFCLASLITMPAARPQVSLKARVPFAFMVADRILPAGEYTVSSPDRGVIRLVSSEQQVITSIPVAESFTDPNGKNALIFVKIGKQYFLRQIVSSITERLNTNVPMWRQEEAARSGEGILVAMR